MSATRVRRGSGGRPAARKSSGRVAVPRKIASRLPMEQAQANRLARWMFGLFVAAIAVVAAIALGLPSKIGTAVGEAVGEAGFRVRSVEVQGTKRMNPAPVYRIALDQKAAALPLVDVADIRQRLLGFGWVKDARVTRRYPDTLVVDIVERKPAALWQDEQRLNLVDAEGVVLDRVPVSQMPDLPLLIGRGANAHATELSALLNPYPALRAQLVSATWVGERRWDLVLQTNQLLMLPEGQETAKSVLGKFLAADKTQGLLGNGTIRYDLRIPGKMTACCKVPDSNETSPKT
ncbi:FtsQ-type POTRA domain-containing protein [Sphingomonas rhizophila]|uniref:Cell division protein FtsQ n=1 Tax=Sphingomonas rhizophila TaxID=2071607 RepID=A0A7G9S9B9_9SPHN|nr:FtsQ-type POTRA domain-containing protein [Sphingomonas rhizophila]QNN64444.1 FtsQ-type POTRA domain-containing protein [Sphingomonas rhizophila]